MYERAAQLYQQSVLSENESELAADSLEELGVTLEELQVAEEELIQQNQELATACELVEAERQRYQELFEEAPDGYLVIDPQGTIREANSAATRLLNVKQPFLIGKPLINYIPKSDRSAFRSQLNWLHQLERVQDWEVRLMPRRSLPFDAVLTVTTIRNQVGQPISLRWLLRDMTERQRAEAEIRTLNAQLEQRVSDRTAQLEAANHFKDEALWREQAARAEAEAARTEAEAASRIKDEFLAIVSHELRSPLNAILGWARLLQSRSFDENQTKKALEVIERNAKAQTQLIEDLLDISRIIRGRVRLFTRPTNLVQAIEAAIDTVRPTAVAKTIQISSWLDSEVSIVSGDPDRLLQVVWNLLSNAIKFTPVGGRVEVKLTSVNSHAQIQVTDTGQGIAPDFLPYVFERFRQAESTTTRAHGGLGLGLAIVRNLVELHGGRVRVESPGEGQGATFIVQLPTIVNCPGVSNSEQLAVRGQASSLEDTLSLDGVRVLVVDDEIDTRDFLVAALEQYGAEATAAASAGEAFWLLERWQPDVLVSDIGMPVEDGYTLIRRIRALTPEQGGLIPAAALTAYAREEDRIQALRAGFQMHVPKPIEPMQLVAVVAKLAGRIALA
nr:ATP-binding protein [Chroococcidiopsis sp. [FACHB-1243]]